MIKDDEKQNIVIDDNIWKVVCFCELESDKE